MSRNKKNNMTQPQPQPQPQFTPATQMNSLPAPAEEMVSRTIGELIQESVERNLDFSGCIRQADKELDVSYTPPKDEEGSVKKREFQLRFRDNKRISD